MTKSTKKPLYRRAGNRPDAPVRPPRPFRHAIFASEAEYNRSVASVVARIRSGQVQARIPDE